MILDLLLVLATAATLAPEALGLPTCVADARFHVGLAASALAALRLAQRAGPSSAILIVLASIHLAPVAALHIGRAPASTTDREMTVATVNLWIGNSDPRPLLRFLEEEEPDVVAVLEVTHAFHRFLETPEDGLPHRAIHTVAFVNGEPFRMGLLSRHPIVRHRRASIGEHGSPFVEATIATPTGEVDVLVVHALPPPFHNDLRDRFIRDIGSRLDPARPAIVLGDFNATLFAPPLRELMSAAGLRDSRVGFGRLPTWAPPRWPWLRLDLDHVLVSRHFGVSACWTGPSIGSDHRPLVARLRGP